MTGRKLSSILAEHRFAVRDVAALIIVLCKPRDELYRGIDQRVVRMLEAGLVGETRELLQRFRDAPVLKTLGYAQAREYLEGRLPEADLAAEIALHTRRFAKRQMTYWRNEPLKRGWRVCPGDGDHAEEVGNFESSPQRAHKRMKGFRALRYSESELQEAIRERLSRSLDTSEVWMVWLR
jgi:tRNA A37 N6-isopentenylltransferase MiaA